MNQVVALHPDRVLSNGHRLEDNFSILIRLADLHKLFRFLASSTLFPPTALGSALGDDDRLPIIMTCLQRLVLVLRLAVSACTHRPLAQRVLQVHLAFCRLGPHLLLLN